MIYDAHSIFLAKLIGLALMIFGIAILVRMESFQNSLKDISKSDALMTMISVLPLIAGLAIVLAHNLWEANWTILVTIMGWIILLAAIVRLFFHKMIMKKMAEKWQSKPFFYVIGIVIIIIGAIFTYFGFWS